MTINPDGTYIFSGQFRDKKKDLDWDISFAMKSRTGAVYIFHYEGDATNGIQFTKTGQSDILRDNFASFAKNHQTAWEYAFHLSKEGRAKQYAEEEKEERRDKEGQGRS